MPSGPLGPKVQVGNISVVGVSSFPKDHKMVVDEIVGNEMFGESSDEFFKGFDEVEVLLHNIMEENNTSKEQGNKKDMARRTWNKEVNKLVMKCYLMSEPFKRGNRRKAYGLWQDIIETTEQR